MSDGRRKRIERHLTEDELDDALATVEDPELVRRLCFVKNLYRGDTLAEAADRVGASQPTGSRWADQWNERGFGGLGPEDRSGRPTKLDASERVRARALIRSNPSVSAAELGQLIEDEFGVTYHPKYLYQLKRRLRGGAIEDDQHRSE